MAKKKKKTFIEGVTGLGGSSLDKNYLAVHDCGTFYGGLQVTKEIKEELERQPISDFMHFEPKGKSYIMKYHIPERGRGAGRDGVERDYKIREYYNRCMKYFTKGLLNEDGTNRFLDVMDYMDEYAVSMQRQLLDARPESLSEFAKELEIPENEVEEFSAFLNNNADIVMKSITQVQGRINMIAGFERLWVNLPAIKHEPEYGEAAKYIQSSMEDYVNTRKQLQAILDMNPESQMSDLSFFACDDGALCITGFAKQCTCMHNAKNEPAIGENGQRKTFKYKDNGEDLNNESESVGKFPNHDVYCIPVTMNNEQCIMTLETTASPYQKAFFHPDEEFHGFGVYRNMEELEQTYMHPLQAKYTFENAENKKRHIKIMNDRYIENLKNRPEMEGKITDVTFSIKGASKYCATDMAMANYTISKKSLGDMLRKLGEVDKWHVKSSDQFKNMRRDLEALKSIESLEDFKTKTENLMKTAREYIQYKHPNGNPKKEAKMSDLAYSRLDFAKEVLSFAHTMNGEVKEAILDDQQAQKVNENIAHLKVRDKEERSNNIVNEEVSFKL